MANFMALVPMSAESFESGNTTAGQVLSANGVGGAVWRPHMFIPVPVISDWAAGYSNMAADIFSAIGTPWPEKAYSENNQIGPLPQFGTAEFCGTEIVLLYKNNSGQVARLAALVSAEEGLVSVFPENVIPPIGSTCYLVEVNTLDGVSFGGIHNQSELSLASFTGVTGVMRLGANTLHLMNGRITGVVSPLVQSPRVFRALITKLGGDSSPPTQVVLENTLMQPWESVTCTWTTVGTATYRGTFSPGPTNDVTKMVFPGSGRVVKIAQDDTLIRGFMYANSTYQVILQTRPSYPSEYIPFTNVLFEMLVY